MMWSEMNDHGDEAVAMPKTKRFEGPVQSVLFANFMPVKSQVLKSQRNPVHVSTTKPPNASLPARSTRLSSITECCWPLSETNEMSATSLASRTSLSRTRECSQCVKMPSAQMGPWPFENRLSLAEFTTRLPSASAPPLQMVPSLLPKRMFWPLEGLSLRR